MIPEFPCPQCARPIRLDKRYCPDCDIRLEVYNPRVEIGALRIAGAVVAGISAFMNADANFMAPYLLTLGMVALLLPEWVLADPSRMTELVDHPGLQAGIKRQRAYFIFTWIFGLVLAAIFSFRHLKHPFYANLALDLALTWGINRHFRFEAWKIFLKAVRPPQTVVFDGLLVKADVRGEDADILHKMAVNFDFGIGMRQDKARAGKLYCEAALAGNMDSEHALLQMIGNREETGLSREETLAWLKQAGEKGNSKAKKLFEDLRDA